MHFLWVWAIILLALIMDWLLMKKARGFYQSHQGENGESKRVYLLGAYSPILTWLVGKRPIPKLHLRLTTVNLPKSNLLELGLIIAWAIYVGRQYSNFDLNIWPVGGEFIMGMQTNFIWPLLSKCGGCIFWNGFVNGGSPSFVDMHGGLLHPLVILTDLIWGPINGAKATIIASLAMGGIALWWLTKVMGLGRIARLWSAFMAVASGFLAARMELGLTALVLSTAACSLVIPPAIELALTGKRRSAVVLGIILGIALLSGQGYSQVGLVLAIFPALCVLLVNGQLRFRPVWKEFALAFLLALMLAGVFLAPFLHFYPYWIKDSDAYFSSAQPMEYELLNLVIRDPSFYRTDSLHKHATPSLYSNYVGWAPVLLAIAAISLAPREKYRLLAFFLVAFVLVYMASSANTLKQLAQIMPELAFGVRHSAFIASLSGPLVLGLAAWGLDLLLKVKAPNISFIPSEPSETKHFLSINLLWVLLIIPLYWSIKSAYDYGRNWLIVNKMPAGAYTMLPILSKAITPGTTQIIQAPIGEYQWYPEAVEANLKLTEFFRPWRWRDRAFPPALVEGTHGEVDTASASFLGETVGLKWVVHPENQYAYVDVGGEYVPCVAKAMGGNIDITCQNDTPGVLTVMENQWSGWTVRMDGAPAKLERGQWLSTSAPAGLHHYAFRYRPWDVVVGLLLTVAGLLLSAWLWWRAPSA